MIARAMGAAAGGLLGSALLPVAVAFADDYAIVPDPSSIEEVTGIYGSGFFGVPQLPRAVDGSQLFDIDDTTVGTSTHPDVVGTFDADEAIVAGSYGNQELLVTSDVSGTVGTAAGDVPPVGSVFDTESLGPFGSELYSALASPTPGADVISDTLITPIGDFNLPDSSFDAAAGLATDSLATVPVPFVGAYDIVPDPASPEAITAINGLSPAGVIVQGDAVLDVVNTADGTTTSPDVVGTFDADKAATHDALGDHSEALLVTSDVSGTPGTAAGDVPPVDSIYNILYIGHSGVESVYSDLPTASGGNVISETLITPIGDFTVPTQFNAAEALAPFPAVPVDHDYDIVADPASTEEFTGINGNPPGAVAVQGYQLFDVDHTTGTATSPDVVGTFNADVTTTVTKAGDQSETLLVTSDVSGTPGTAAGDVPLPGSVIDTTTFGDSGLENIYSDLASTTPGTDVISDTLVTPIGDLTIPLHVDLFANLAADIFTVF
ncbi:MAG TPA: hypothetical protein VMB04_15230 [Mycobacterium sp.]|nr:hypothetical protein [Mycobacterium sp.]